MTYNKGKGRGLEWLKENVAYSGEDCLIWPLSRTYQGYGQLGYFGKVKKAHHVMCMLVNGPRPSKRHEAAHSCGNGHNGCCHPKHVSWKTPAENRADTIKHGTYAKKVARKLTIDQVEEIKASEVSCFDLAKQYDVSISAIFKIKRGETWAKPRSKWTRNDIKRIREVPDNQAATVGKALGMSPMTIARLRDGKTFQGVE